MKAGLWVGGSSDLYCKVRMGAEEVAFNLDFGQHFGDVCVLSFLLGKGLDAVQFQAFGSCEGNLGMWPVTSGWVWHGLGGEGRIFIEDVARPDTGRFSV